MPKETLFKNILIFTDGACSKNPGPGGYGCIICYPNGDVEEIGGRAASTTNNRMEMTAVIQALHKINLSYLNASSPSPDKVHIWVLTDSTYVIRGITQWIHAWKLNNWKTKGGETVINRDLWEQMDQIVASFQQRLDIEWKYLRGHSDIPGNERCDKIAVCFSHDRHCELYKGSLLQYPYPIHDIPDDLSLPTQSHQRKKQKQAYSYLSCVNGVLQRHSSWPECESQVKNKSNARFKKSTSRENEKEIVKAWGLKEEDLENI